MKRWWWCGLSLLLGEWTAWGQAVLPTSYAWDTSTTLPAGWVATGMGTPYASGQPTANAGKFDDANDRLVIAFSAPPGELTYWVRGFTSAGTVTTGLFEIAESEDGLTYAPLAIITNKTTTWMGFTNYPAATTRFLRFLYTNKVYGNIALDTVALSSGVTQAPPVVSFDADSAPALTEGEAPITLDVSISRPAALTVEVASVGVAVLDADFSLNTTSVVFTAEGPTNVMLTLSCLDDGFPESSELLELNLVVPPEAVAGSFTNFSVLLQDNEPTVRFAAAARSVVEGSGTVLVEIQKSSAVGLVTGVVALAGSALAGDDYLAGDLSFSLPGATTSAWISLEVSDDGVVEGAETVDMQFAGVAGAFTGEPTNCVVTIEDNEAFTVMAANLSIQLSAGVSFYEDTAGRIFQGLKPDVVAVQEFIVAADPNSRRAYVDQYFGTNYSFHVESVTNDGQALPNGIISRWPILQAGEWADTNINNRDFAWATIDLPGPRDLHVVSVHIKATSGSTNDPLTRLAQATALHDLISTSFPAADYVVLAGDLNLEDRNEAALRALTNLLSDAHQPADQYFDRDSNSTRSNPFDLVLPNFTLASNEVPTVLAGQMFPDGLVFDGRLWPSLPSPILPGDTAPTGRQHMAVMKTFALQPVTPGYGAVSNVLAYYDFEDAGGLFVNGPDRTLPQVGGSLYTTDDGVTTNLLGHSGRAISDTGWANTSKYFTFTLSISNGYAASITGLQFCGRSTATGPIFWSLRSSADAFAADLASGVQVTDSVWYVHQPALSLGGLTGSITFRIYGTNASANSGSWAHDTVKVMGAVTVPGDSDGDGLPDTWELQYFAGLGEAGLHTDADADGFPDVAEYRAGTQPNNPTSALQVAVFRMDTGSAVVKWDSVAGKTYTLERSTNVMSGYAAVSPVVLAAAPANLWTDAPPEAAVWFYRVRLEP